MNRLLIPLSLLASCSAPAAVATVTTATLAACICCCVWNRTTNYQASTNEKGQGALLPCWCRKGRLLKRGGRRQGRVKLLGRTLGCFLRRLLLPFVRFAFYFSFGQVLEKGRRRKATIRLDVVFRLCHLSHRRAICRAWKRASRFA